MRPMSANPVYRHNPLRTALYLLAVGLCFGYGLPAPLGAWVFLGGLGGFFAVLVLAVLRGFTR